MRYGSDLIIEWLADAGIRHVALNPGATLRGLHDSLVRSERLTPVVALHEEVAVGVAHGYAKATGEPMAAFVHDLVGLQHASLAIFNAFVDRVPMLIIGGSGPRAEEDRRPWLDWIHTGMPQGALVRDIVKWDAEPTTMYGVRESLQRGMRMARTGPQGPVYLSVDAGLQEQPVDGDHPSLPPPEVDPITAPPEVVSEVAARLRSAERPLITVDRPVRGLIGSLVQIAERLSAAVVDFGGGCNFPTTHWADQSSTMRTAMAEADVVLALEVRDVAWATTETQTATRRTTPLLQPHVPIIAVGLSELRHRGFLVPEALVPETRYVLSDAGSFASQLSLALDGEPTSHHRKERRHDLGVRHEKARAASAAEAVRMAEAESVHPAHLARSVWNAVKDGPWQLANGLLEGWPRHLWDITEEAQYLGRSGGEGLGYGLPASLGAALAHRDSDVLVVDIQADGDLMYTASALWTAAHHRLPLLIVLHNNRMYGKDGRHQTEMAAMRQRSDDVVPVGIHLDRPCIDFAALARAQDVEGIGPVKDPAEAMEVIRKAARVVRTERRPLLVDIVCGPD